MNLGKYNKLTDAHSFVCTIVCNNLFYFVWCGDPLK